MDSGLQKILMAQIARVLNTWQLIKQDRTVLQYDQQDIKFIVYTY